jgi:hypothetical protein
MAAPTSKDAYTYTVTADHGTAPAKGAKEHHVYNSDGRLIRFKNPCPSFGNWHNVSLWGSAVLYFGYVVSYLSSPPPCLIGFPV